MKKHFLITLLLMVLAMASTAQNKKIAILETVDREGKVPYGIRLQLRSNLTYAISNTPGYEGYDRVDMAQIMGEHDFQRTGLVSEEQIRKLGEMTGAGSILVAETAIYDNDHIIITAKILNVETASVERSVPPQVASTNPKEMQEACVEVAEKLLVQASIVVEEPKEEPMVEKLLITKGKDFYYLDGQRLTDNQYMELIKNCPEAWVNYEKGMKQRKTGRILLIIGGGCVVASTIIAGIIEPTKFWDYAGYGAEIGIYVGVPISIASIPFFISGKYKKKDAYKTYNQYCAQPSTTLSVGPATQGMGVGLYLNF